METIYLILIILGSLFAGMKCNIKGKCCGCEIELDKEESDNGVMRTIKIVKRSSTM